jgi:hypothetical protein
LQTANAAVKGAASLSGGVVERKKKSGKKL